MYMSVLPSICILLPVFVDLRIQSDFGLIFLYPGSFRHLSDALLHPRVFYSLYTWYHDQASVGDIGRFPVSQSDLTCSRFEQILNRVCAAFDIK